MPDRRAVDDDPGVEVVPGGPLDRLAVHFVRRACRSCRAVRPTIQIGLAPGPVQGVGDRPGRPAGAQDHRPGTPLISLRRPSSTGMFRRRPSSAAS